MIDPLNEMMKHQNSTKTNNYEIFNLESTIMTTSYQWVKKVEAKRYNLKSQVESEV